MIFPTIMAWSYFVALARPISDGAIGPVEANPLLRLAYGGFKIVQFAFPLVYLAWVDPSSLRPPPPRLRGLGVGLGFGLIVAAGIFLLYQAFLRDWLLTTAAPRMIRTKVAELDMATPARYALLALFLSGIHSLLEEYYWRWFVFGRLRRYLPSLAAIVLSSVAFMAHHVIILAVFFPGHFLMAVVPFSLGVASGGAVWAWWYERSGNLYAVWLSHLLIDAAIMGVGYDLVFR